MSETILFSARPAYQNPAFYSSSLPQRNVALNNAPVVQAQKPAVEAKPIEENKHFSGTTEDVKKALEAIDISLHLDAINKAPVGSKEFKEALFDVSFNAVRRMSPTIDGKKLDNWRKQYDDNYAHLEKSLEKLHKLPESEQRKFAFALNILTILAPINPDHYRKNLEELANGQLKPADFLKQAHAALDKLQANKKALQGKRLLTEASKLQKLGLVTTDDYIRYIGGGFLPQKRYRFEKNVDHLTKVIKSPPTSPRVLLFWNAREGKIGHIDNPNTSHENAALTDKLRDYWQQKGCQVILVDGSGGSTNQPLSMTSLFKATQPSGFITGGGPDINPADPFVKNLKSILELADKQNLPYFAECLGHQLIGMLKSGETDYKKYVGQLHDRKSYSPEDISLLDTREMEHDHALYSGDLGKMLARRETKRALGQKINPIRVYSIHNNIVNDKKDLEPRVFIAARSFDNEKAPEILAKQDKDGKRQIISTQFHPSELTAESRYLQKMTPFDEEFGLAILNSSINTMKNFHKKNIALTDGDEVKAK